MKCEYGALVGCYWWGKTKVLSVKTYPFASLSTKNPTMTGLELNLCLHSEKLVINHVYHGMAFIEVHLPFP
jgi:hypothetical protein